MQKLSIDKPTVSIGLPVFNGEKYLEATLDSILLQTYQDFELIISDNASTDQTQRICRAYAAKDRRIRYFRNEKNLGASKNFNRVFELSSGQYFKWAAYDDIIHPDYLLKCIKVVDTNPSVVLCHSKTGRIDEYGEVTGDYNFEVKPNWSKPHNRFGDLIKFDNYNWVALFGLMRSSLLRKTRLFGSYVSADRTLLAEIGLVGQIYSVPEFLFFRREHSETYTNRDHKSNQVRLDWWKPTKFHSKLTFTYWKMCREYFKSVQHIPLNRSERVLCYIKIIKWLIAEGWILMSSDLLMNIINLFRWNKPLLACGRAIAQFFWRLGGIK